MKKSIILILSFVFVDIQLAGAQQYKTTADTIQLHKEYTEISNEISLLTAKLGAARNHLAEYQSKANKTKSEAQDAASANSVQAEKATNGNVKEARKSKRKARKALREAKYARSASYNVKEQQSRINTLTAQIDQKRERLYELELMRKGINEQH